MFDEEYIENLYLNSIKCLNNDLMDKFTSLLQKKLELQNCKINFQLQINLVSQLPFTFYEPNRLAHQFNALRAY